MPKRTIKNHYKVEIAAYPVEYERSVVSENKICVQFHDTELKVRAPNELKELIPNSSSIGPYIPVKTHPDTIAGLNVGMVLPVLEDTQMALLESYKIHMEKYPGRLTNMLQNMQQVIKGILDE